jgi:hypothetical protein
MADPLTILVLVTAAHASDAATAATTAAARRALDDATVLLEAREVLPTRDDAVALGERVRAEVVVELDWLDDRRAKLQVCRAKDEPWIVRELTFEDVDAPAERGRTLGLTIAAVVRREGEPPREERPLAPSPPARPANDNPPKPPLPPRERAWVGAGEISVAGAVGLGGDAGSVGGEVGGRLFVAPPLALRLGGGVRLGAVPALGDARATTVRLGGGLAVRVFRAGADDAVSQPLEIALRADLLALRHAVTRDFGGVETTHDRWMAGADALAEVAWYLTPAAAVAAAAGVEAAFGTTTLSVGGAPQARIPPFRAVVEMGARVRF